MLFTLKYLPSDSSQVIGQQKAVAILKDFIINYKKQKQKAVLLHGPIGTGKTSAVYALAKELNYDLLELNSSDLRNEKELNSFLGSALGQKSLFFRPKIILIDEVDNVFGVEDRGGITAILKWLDKSSSPLILTANEPSHPKLKSLCKHCLMLEFKKIEPSEIALALKQVCEQEKIKYEEKAINRLARQVDGDLRSALIDLQVCSSNQSFTTVHLSLLSDRQRKESIFNALLLIFKSTSVERALPALEGLDLDINEVLLWLDENLPKEYLSLSALAKAYEHLARADVFQGRIHRSQQWRFLVYINNFLTAGVSSAKEQKNTNLVQYKPTLRLLRIWQAKMKNAKKKEIAAKLAKKMHLSEGKALGQVPYLQAIFQKGDSAKIARELDLTEEEVEWLVG